MSILHLGTDNFSVPAKRIINNGYNLTLASLGLVDPEKPDHAEPEPAYARAGATAQRVAAGIAAASAPSKRDRRVPSRREAI